MRIQFLFALFLIPPSMYADQKPPKEYPFHAKVTATGTHKQTDTGAVLLFGLPGIFVNEKHRIFTLTLKDRSTVTVDLVDYQRHYDKLLVMGEEVDFREDAKQEHAWIHWIKPNPKNSDLPGKDAETKYDIIQIAAPPELPVDTKQDQKPKANE